MKEVLSEEEFEGLLNFADTQLPELESDPTFAPRLTFWTRASKTLDEKVKSGEITSDRRDLVIGATLSSKEKREEIDFLTSLYNRRGFETRLEVEIERALRGNRPLSIAFMDLDKFKDINDRYGHPAGDSVLRAWAAYLRVSLRATDILGRLGGEEVVAILPETNIKGGFSVLDRVREKMPLALAEVIIDLNLDRSITMSVGVAEFENEDTPLTLLTRADQRVYLAKASGRNKVVAADQVS